MTTSHCNVINGVSIGGVRDDALMLRQSPRHRFVALVVAVVLVAAACAGDDDDAIPTQSPATTPTPVPTEAEIEAPSPTPVEVTETVAAEVPFSIRPSVNQFHVLEADPGTELELVDSEGVIRPGVADDAGSFLWRDIPEGDYSVRLATSAEVTTPPASVTAPDQTADPAFYADQQIGEGFGYVTTRDGTTLSVNVSLPGGDGPFPTVVEYSGYDPSNPDNTTFAQLYTTLGYAYVGVNMRGTGCSGGSFEFFEPVQLTDGYDMIEAIAAQPWVLHNSVGMVGVSYPGISQLFVASTRPPSLAAITPLSVLDDAARATLYPGGILNTGFAVAWSDERENDAAPYGQGWEQAQVDAGDTECEANQALRLQNTDASALISANPYYVPEVADPISPTALADRIEVPVFLAGAWQDEQTGGRFPEMLDDLSSSRALFATMVNGSHTESIANLAIFERYVEFLELYVARRTPQFGGAALVAPILSNSLTGATGLSLPSGDRFSGMSYEDALAAFEADDRIRILFESGNAEGTDPGSPLPRYEAGFASWPIESIEPQSWYLHPDGSLQSAPFDADADASSYTSDPTNAPATTYEGSSSGIWATDVAYDWQEIPEGTGLSWVSAPLTDDTVVIGSGSLDIWLRSSAEDTDLEVTISEIRPDGTEVYIQSGWLRASHRALDMTESRPERPVHTHREADAELLPAGEFVEVRVEIFPFGHAFRTGSSIRITVDAPGGARPTWAFDTIADGETNEIAHDAEHPSKLVLAVVPGVEVPEGVPACGALRSQPCRSGG